jgi:tetratricopeptide (TPR) repeat protein
MSKPSSPASTPEFATQHDYSDILGISTPQICPPKQVSSTPSEKTSTSAFIDPWGSASVEIQSDRDDRSYSLESSADPWASDTEIEPPIIRPTRFSAGEAPPTIATSFQQQSAPVSAKSQSPVRSQPIQSPPVAAPIRAAVVEVSAPAVTARDLALQYCERGRKSLAAQDYAQARSAYKVAIEWDANLAIAHSGSAQVYQQIQDYEAALLAWGAAIECDPTQLDFYYQRALINKTLKSYYQVLVDCKYILERVAHPSARWLNAVALVKLENYQIALASLDRHIEDYPQDPNGHCYRGICYERLEKLPQALADLDRAISLQAGQPVFHHARGRARQKSGDLAGALADFNLTIERKPQAAVFDDRAEVHRCLGDRAAARLDCDRAIELNPKFVNAYLRRGLIFVELGDLELALLDFDITIEFDPQHTDAYIQRSWTHFRRNDYPRAKQDCRSVKSLDLSSFWANYISGVVDSLSGLQHTALKNFSRAIELSPHYVSARYHRGIVHYELGNIAAAMADFEQARSLQDRGLERLVDRDETGFYAEGLALYHLGQPEAARTVLILGALSAKRFNNPSFHQLMLAKIEDLGMASGELSSNAANSGRIVGVASRNENRSVATPCSVSN